MAGPRPQPQGPVCLSSPQVPGRCADPLARTVAVRASPIRPKTGVRAGAISGDSARCRRRTDLGLGARPSNRLLERRARSQRLPAPPSPSTAPSGTAGSAPFRRLFGQNLIDLGRSEKVGSPLILPRHEALVPGPLAEPGWIKIPDGRRDGRAICTRQVTVFPLLSCVSMRSCWTIFCLTRTTIVFLGVCSTRTNPASGAEVLDHL